MDTVSLYLAIKVIHSSCYIADLFTIAPTAHSEANKLLKQRHISPPKPISRFSNYMWNAFALPADFGGHCTMELTHTNAPLRFQESYKPWKTGWQCLRLFLSSGRCRCHFSVNSKADQRSTGAKCRRLRIRQVVLVLLVKSFPEYNGDICLKYSVCCSLPI